MNTEQVKESYLKQKLNCLSGRELGWAVVSYTAVVALFVFLVMMVIFSWSGDAKVVETLGLVGTFASLFLALAAMIYAFMQAFSQERNSEKINNSVHDLKGISEEIKVNSKRLNDSTESITTISEQLHSIREDFNHQRNSQKQMSEMLTKLMLGSNDNNGSSSSKKITVTMDLNELSSTFILTIGFVNFLKQNKIVGNLKRIPSVLGRQILKFPVVEKQEDREKLYALLYGSISDMMRLLVSMGVVVVDSNKDISKINISQFTSLISDGKTTRTVGDTSVITIIDSFNDDLDVIRNTLSES